MYRGAERLGAPGQWQKGCSHACRPGGITRVLHLDKAMEPWHRIAEKRGFRGDAVPHNGEGKSAIHKAHKCVSTHCACVQTCEAELELSGDLGDFSSH